MYGSWVGLGESIDYLSANLVFQRQANYTRVSSLTPRRISVRPHRDIDQTHFEMASKRVVIDIGSEVLRGGFAGEPEPRVILKSGLTPYLRRQHSKAVWRRIVQELLGEIISVRLLCKRPSCLTITGESVSKPLQDAVSHVALESFGVIEVRKLVVYLPPQLFPDGCTPNSCTSCPPQPR